MRLEPKKVLVVEDEAKISEVIRSFLESKGFVVFVAENGRQAFGLIDKENISMIILDLMLPDMSGEDICIKIRKTSRIPVIMVTAKVDEVDMLKGLGIGADDYMTKPFSLKELYARIEVVLRRSSDDLLPLYNKNSFMNGDLEVDFQYHTIKKQGREVNLTTSEYKILASMIKYPNKVFAREELIRIALGDEFEGFDRAIDSHIKNIRQKIETDTKNPDYLITIHGTGYKFGGY
ncbi:MAG: response regulator transcription factor [Peptostreptococcaceae bacterium]|nr:response regulator transcription factor [Peptostreptococcaceae bacterium]